MKNITLSITAFLLKEKIIGKNEIKLYIFGINLFMKYLFNLVLVLILGVLNRSIFVALLFTMFFVFVRSYAGGIHLKSEFYCVLFSLLVIQSVILITKIEGIPSILYIVMAVISYIGIIVSGPVDNKNRQFDEIEVHYFSKKLLINVSIVMALLMLAFNYRLNDISEAITLSLFCNLMSMLGGKYFRNRKSWLFL